MTKRVYALMLTALMLFACVPTGMAVAAPNDNERTIGTGELTLDMDAAGGYEGDYVVIYNPSTSSGSTYSTGNMSGLIETDIDPYANMGGVQNNEEDELFILDVDAQIAEQNSNRPISAEPAEGVRTTYNVGDTASFNISNYSPGPSNLMFECVAKGDHCYVWTPASNDANYYPLDVIDETYPQLVCDEFESKYAAMNSSFGDHYNGSNGDGRVNLMYYNIDDGYEPGVSNSYVAGYFSSYDFTSNGVPMIHIDTYPCVYYVNSSGETILRPQNSYNVFCHEYQHLINYSQTGGMETWLNESMSAAAEEICYPGSSASPRIQSWINYSYNDNDDWLSPPSEFEYSPEYELHNGFSMYAWSNYLDYVLPLYAQVSLFSQYLYSHYGNTIFRQITQAYNNSAVSAIATATGANVSELVKNFRIALVANEPNAYDGLYGFQMQEGYDPADYHNVQNIYNLLGPVVYTASTCNIAGGGAITVKPVAGVYNPPSNANVNLVYIGITRNIATEPVELTGMEITPESAVAYVGYSTSLTIIRTPMNANRYSVVWESSDNSVATVQGGLRSAAVTGVAPGTAVVTCTVTDGISGNVFTDTASVTIEEYPDLNSALNIHGGNLSFTNDATYPWAVNMEFSGRAVAESTNRSISSSSSTVFTVIEMEAGETLSFDWSVSSESNYDYLMFYVNGERQDRISGNVNWAHKTYTAATTGTYTFAWTYSKDSSVNSGNDAGYVDNVEYSGDTGGIPGDVDGNGAVETGDALAVLRHILDIQPLSNEGLARADVSGDGNISMEDALAILRIALGID